MSALKGPKSAVLDFSPPFALFIERRIAFSATIPPFQPLLRYVFLLGSKGTLAKAWKFTESRHERQMKKVWFPPNRTKERNNEALWFPRVSPKEEKYRETAIWFLAGVHTSV